ncbi:MAG: phosphoribosyltransferase family protein, partial [Microgenomates group bacterium]
MNSTPLTYPNEPITFVSLSWDELEQLVFSLSRDILLANPTGTPSGIDRIVTLAKGGWPMARSLSDFLGGVPVLSFGVKSYSGIGTQDKEISIYQDLSTIDPNEHILLFDDIADTGKSLEFTIHHLQTLGVQKIIVATVFYKPKSIIRPNFYGSETNSWVIFPYEFQETILD